MDARAGLFLSVLSAASAAILLMMLLIALGALDEARARECSIACEGAATVTFGAECYCATEAGGLRRPSGRCGSGGAE